MPGSLPSSPFGGAGNTPSQPALPATGTFPDSPSGQGLGLNGIVVTQIGGVPLAIKQGSTYVANPAAVPAFFGYFNISNGTEQQAYISSGAGGQPVLNANAMALMQYHLMDATERESLQQSLVNAGLLAATDANGAYNSASTTAFKGAITNAAVAGTDVGTYLQQYSGTNYPEGALQTAISAAQKEAQAPVTATETNPTTASADLNQAFDQTLGYAPNAAQTSAFTSDIQSQDLANAEAPHEAAVQQLAMLRSDQSQLSQMGPNDITAIIQAYTNAIHGANPLAGNVNAPQGPATGSNPANTSQYLTPGSKLPPGTTVGFNPSGTEMVANTLPKVTPSTTQQPPGTMAQLGHMASSAANLLNPFSGWNANAVNSDVSGLTGAGTPYVNQTSTTSTPTPGMATAPNLPPGLAGTTPSYGGIYALTPADWAEAQKLNSTVASYAKQHGATSAGAAPAAIQLQALTSLLTTAYDNNGGSWANAIISVAGGDPKAASTEDVPASKQNLQTFATNIANEVNNQLTALTNQINTENVTVKTAAPDISAEANAAAKAADPVGYTAANFASWGSLVGKMIYGRPQDQIQSTADTFTGPAPTSALAGTTA